MNEPIRRRQVEDYQEALDAVRAAQATADTENKTAFIVLQENTIGLTVTTSLDHGGRILEAVRPRSFYE